MKKMKFITLVTLAFFMGTVLQAQIAPVDENGVAIGGYDVVTYFKDGPQRGFKEFSAKHNGTTYYFYSKENKAKFKASPEKYLPQFGGYCAWGVGAQKAKFPIDPESYDIIDGKLYLFFNAPNQGKRFDTVLDWNSRTTELRKAAHANWPAVKNS